MDDQNLAAELAALKKRMAEMQAEITLLAVVIEEMPIGRSLSGEVTVKDGNGRVIATLETDATGVTSIKLVGPGKAGPV